MGPRLYFGMYFDLPPITMIISKAQRVLGLKPTSFGEGLKQTYKWYLRHHEKPSTDYSFENQLLAKAAQLAS
jgi:nucleoside-diphosphate-sugar epimerase